MFVVCGEALIDVFATGDTPTGVALDARVGGSPFNVAVGLARLGQPVAFLGAVSRDFLGDRLMRTLRDEGVDTASTTRVDSPTTLGVVGLDARGVASYAFYGERGADRQLGIGDLDALPSQMQAIHVGSFATIVEPVASTIAALVEREYGRMPICYDPNVRLNIEPDLAVWRRRLDAMLARCHVLKISDEDLSLLRPGTGMQPFAEEALARGARLVVVTRGNGGAIAWVSATPVEVPALPVLLVDTVGAGDSFQAALLTWLAEHGCLSLPALGPTLSPRLGEALRFAVAAAAITCSRRGADLPRRQELAPSSP